MDEHPERITFWTDAIRANQGWIQARNIGFHNMFDHTGSKQMQSTARVRLEKFWIARAWQCGTRLDVSTHQHRLENSGRGSGTGDTLESSGSHSGQGERWRVQSFRDRIDFAHIIERIASDTFGIARVRFVNLVTRNVFAVFAGDTEVFGDGFQTVARHVSSHKIMPPNRIERVEHFPTGEAVTLLAPAPTTGTAHRFERSRIASKLELDVVRFGPSKQEGQVKSEEVVILDHVRVTLSNHLQQGSNHRGFVAVFRSLEDRFKPSRISHRNHEDPAVLRIES